VIIKNNELIQKYEGGSFSPTSDCFKIFTIENQSFFLYESYESSEKKTFLRVLDANGVIKDTIEIGSRNEFRFIYDDDHKLLKILGYDICNTNIDCSLKDKNAYDNKATVENIKKRFNVRSFIPFRGVGAQGEFRIFKIGMDGKFHEQNDQLEFIKEAENALAFAKDWDKVIERTREDRFNYILGFVGLLYKIDDEKKRTELYNSVAEYIGIDVNIDIFMDYWKLSAKK
jgi:hypothetical protein